MVVMADEGHRPRKMRALSCSLTSTVNETYTYQDHFCTPNREFLNELQSFVGNLMDVA